MLPSFANLTLSDISPDPAQPPAASSTTPAIKRPHNEAGQSSSMDEPSKMARVTDPTQKATGVDDQSLSQIPPSSRLDKVISSIKEAHDTNALNPLDDAHVSGVLYALGLLKPFTEEELTNIARHINLQGVKLLMIEFYKIYGSELKTDFFQDLYRNATHRWWMKRWRGFDKDIPILNFQPRNDGIVSVDLWHTRRGNDGPSTFKEFTFMHPTFFFGSYGEVMNNLDELRTYVEEAEPGEDNRLYVKRGRFEFKPLLWFDDKRPLELSKEQIKGIQGLISTHPHVSETQKIALATGPTKDTKELWKKMLYHTTESFYDKKYAMPLRLDNNCVDNCKPAMDLGFQGTLTVDVSGFVGAALPPGTAKYSDVTESIVIFDVPGTVKSEGEWELIG